MRRIIKTNPGIGDSIWLFQKLINAGEKFDFQISQNPPQRGKQIFDLLPQLSASCTYVPGLKYSEVKALNIMNRVARWVDIREKVFYLSANEHLDTGHRIEYFLYDLPTSYKIAWATERYMQRAHELLIGPIESGESSGLTEYIGLYGSAYSTQRAWGFWDEFGWYELAQMIEKHNPDYTFVIIGAEWDLDLGRNLVALLNKAGIKYINTIGEPLGVVIELMKLLKYFFAFPSGLGILAPTVSCPVTMFYPQHHRLMLNTWASKEDIETGRYKGCMFCKPEEIFKWVIENHWI